MNEAALKERVKAIATQKNITFNEVWKQLLLERFLARLSKSHHSEKFIFKGGLLLAQYLEIGRETVDIDFLMTKIRNEANAIENVIKDVIAITLEDGFLFSWFKIEELSQPHMFYPGFRVSLSVHLGKMKDKIQIDIGFGDLVDAVVNSYHSFEYKGAPIFGDEISLLMYPAETIFAEKLETVISKGTTNSRMKDFHDLLLMVRKPSLLNSNKLFDAIQTTFGHRETKLNLPISFEEEGIQNLQKFWVNHLNSLGKFKDKLNLPLQIADLIQEINRELVLLEKIISK